MIISLLNLTSSFQWMYLKVHGRRVIYDGGDCGLFHWDSSVSRYVFVSIQPSHLARHINGLSHEQAVRGLFSMVNSADCQLQARPNPSGRGYILDGKPFSLDGQRRYVENAKKLANVIWEELC